MEEISQEFTTILLEGNKSKFHNVVLEMKKERLHKDLSSTIGF